MTKTKRIFNVVIVLAALSSVLIAFHYNSVYWLSYFRNIKVLPPKLQRIVYLAQTLCILGAALLLIFRNLIFEKRKEFLLPVTSSALCFLFLELGARIYVCHFADYPVQSKVLSYGQCGMKSLYSPHHYLDYFGTPNYVSPDGLNIHNSLGLRGPEIIVPKPADIYRIILIGGSSTYDTSIRDWRNDWARQLEKELRKKYERDNIEVINAGLGGYTSWESLINLEFRLVDLEPDLLIVYEGLNDIHARLVNPLSYRADNSGYRTQWREKAHPFIFKSVLVRLATGINPIGLDEFVVNPQSAALITDTGFVEKLNGTPLEALQKNKPNYFARNLKSMIAISRANNISVLLSTWAHGNRPNDYGLTSHYQYAIAEMNHVIKTLAASEHVAVYDFAKYMSLDKAFWADGRHNNENGAKLKAELFANFIYENKLIDRESVKQGKTQSRYSSAP